MKTNHIFLMTAMAFAASAAVAEPTFNLYGNLDMSLTNTKSSNTAWGSAFTAVPATGVRSTSTTGVSSGVMSESFFGLKGTEDLGNGMEAQFVLESFLDLDTGATSSNGQLLSASSRLSAGPTGTWNSRDEGGFFSRNAYVGLRTNYGLIRLGQIETLGYLSGVKWNPFGTAAINPTTRVFYSTDFYARTWSNVIAYYLKKDGLLFSVQHAPKSDSTAGAGGSKTTAALSYSAGPWSGSVGYETNGDNVAAASAAPAAPARSKSYALHGSYDFGVAKLYAEYGAGKLDREAAGQQDVKSTGYQLGASVPLGNGALLASYASGTQKAENLAGLGVAAGTKFRDVKVYAIGYTYNLSKRTGLYAAYSNERDSYPILGPANALNNLKLETKQLALGVNHKF